MNSRHRTAMTNDYKARALWIAGPGQAEIREETVTAPGPDEVLVRTLFSGVSRGTETLVFLGKVPSSEYARMRAPFQAGDFPAPVKYGYINVGRVEHGPAALVGQTVFCLYPHQTRYVVPASAVHVLPKTVPPARAVLAANLEAAVNAVWDAAPAAGQRIGVVGAGTLGCLAAWLAAQYPACDVELIDVDPAKAAPAEALGLRFALPADATPDADLVIHASGTAAGLATALGLAGFEATIVELSWYGDAAVPVPLGEAFHSRRLTLRASQVSAIATSQRTRFSHARRMQLVLRLLGDSRLDALITGESEFEKLPQVLETLSARPSGTLCHRISYTHEPIAD